MRFAPSPAGAQQIDPRLRDDIERLMRVTGAGTMGAQMASIASDSLLDTMRKVQPQIPDRAVAIIKEVLGVEFTQAFDGPSGIQRQMVDIYARYFTHDEVLAMLDFYGTPVGRKAVAVMPKLAQEGAAAGQHWAAANMVRIGATISERLRAEGLLK